MLSIPAPILHFDAMAPGVAAWELPLTIDLGPVERDGSVLGIADVRIAGVNIWRWRVPGGVREVWDRDAAEWVAESGSMIENLSPDALVYLPDEPQPWQAIVVPAGGVDRAGAAQFATSAGGYPQYGFRARFETSDGESGWSAPSGNVSFGSLADANLMVFGPGDGEKPRTATIARLQLRSPALVTIGGLTIRRAAPGAEIVLSNAAGAAVVLQPDGSIELRPGPGRGVRVTADLETERLVYAPAGGGPKKTLP